MDTLLNLKLLQVAECSHGNKWMIAFNDKVKGLWKTGNIRNR